MDPSWEAKTGPEVFRLLADQLFEGVGDAHGGTRLDLVWKWKIGGTQERFEPIGNGLYRRIAPTNGDGGLLATITLKQFRELAQVVNAHLAKGG